MAIVIVALAICALFLVTSCAQGASSRESASQNSSGKTDDAVTLRFCSEVTARSSQRNAEKLGVAASEAGGNGDCILLEYSASDGRHFALIDTGATWKNDDDSIVTIKWLRDHGVNRLDWMLITHQHGDHMGCADDVLNEFEVDTLYMKHFDGCWVLDGVKDEAEAREILGADAELEKSGDYFIDADGKWLTTHSSNEGYESILEAAISRGTRIVGPSWDEVNPESPICAKASPDLSKLESWSEWLKGNATSQTPDLFTPFNEDNISFAFGPAQVRIVNWQEYDTAGEPWNETSDTTHETVVGENQNSLGAVVQVGDTRAFLAGDIEYAKEKGGLPTFAGDVNDEKRIAEEVGDADFYKVAHHGYNTSSSKTLMATLRPEAAMITNMVDQAAEKVIERLDVLGTTYMYSTEDEYETVVELSPSHVRMARGSDTGWRYETPYHEVSVLDGVDGSTIATLTVRDGHTPEWPDGFEPPVHEGYEPVGLPEMPDRVRDDCQVVVEYQKVG